MKNKISLTLNEFEQRLFERALQIAFTPIEEEALRSDKHRLIHIGLVAWFRAVIAAGKRIEGPMAIATLRKESPAEVAERVGGKIPALPVGAAGDWQMPNRWN